MPWKVTLENKSFLLDDLSPDTLYEIAQRHGITWRELWTVPVKCPAAFYDLLVAVAGRLEVVPPDHYTNATEFDALWQQTIEPVDDDLPGAFGDGALPLESTADDPTTGTSPTSTSPEDGIPTAPEAPASETSNS